MGNSACKLSDKFRKDLCRKSNLYEKKEIIRHQSLAKVK
jgi:hypothetical protein